MNNYPILNFGWQIIDEFTDYSNNKVVVFMKNGDKLILKSNTELDLNYIESIISIQDDSFVEALKETQNILNKN